MSDETYNGWKNYPTWCVNLWLANDQGLYEGTLDAVASGLTYADDHPNTHGERPIWTQEEANRFAVADALKDWVEELAGEAYSDATFVSDLFGWALAHVDWHEIAGAWIETASEQDAVVQREP